MSFHNRLAGTEREFANLRGGVRDSRPAIAAIMSASEPIGRSSKVQSSPPE
jgi:hypothetical protein